MTDHFVTKSRATLIWLGVFVIAVATTVVYLPALHGGFILDDNIYLTEAPIIRASDGLYRFWCTIEPIDYYPVSNSTLWLEWRLWGMNPTGYHVTNLVLHIGASLLLWLILWKLSVPGAFLASLLFAVHPVNVEAVAWIAQRKGLLAAVFFLLSILCYLRAEVYNRNAGNGESNGLPRIGLFYWLSLLSFVLAMLSKGSVAILPIVLLGLAWWQRRRITLEDLKLTVPFFLVAALLTGVHIYFQNRDLSDSIRAASLAERLAGAGADIWFYLSKAIFPSNLVFIYPQWHIDVGNLVWWLPAMAAVAVAAMLWRQRNSWWGRPLLFAVGFFCVALVPVLGFTDVGYMRYSLVADHYQYIAIIAVVALMAALWTYWRQSARGAFRTMANLTVGALVATLMFLSWQQSRLYGSATILYAATLEDNPSSWLLHFNLGNAYDDAQRSNEALQQYQQAISLKPDFVEARYNLGNVLSNAGQTQAAIDQYQRVQEFKPDWAAKVHCALGVLQAKDGHFEKAVEEYRQAMKLKPDSAEFHYNLGNALLALGRTQESTEQYQQTLKLMPDYTDARYKLSRMLAQSGQLSDAIQHYQKLLTLNPDNAELHYNLANSLFRIGRTQEAIEHYRRALQLKPDLAEAYNGLGAALLTIRRPDEALKYFDQALQRKPDYTQAAANQAQAYAQLNRPEEAVATAQKALQLARDGQQTVLQHQIEALLTNFQTNSPKSAVPPTKSP